MVVLNGKKLSQWGIGERERERDRREEEAKKLNCFNSKSFEGKARFRNGGGWKTDGSLQIAVERVTAREVMCHKLGLSLRLVVAKADDSLPAKIQQRLHGWGRKSGLRDTSLNS